MSIIKSDSSFRIVSADIGGTNSNFALFEYKNRDFNLVKDIEIPTGEIGNFNDAFKSILESFSTIYPEIDAVCIAAAGPVENNSCHLINADLLIEGDKISRQYGIPCFVINDFTALSYAVPVLKKDTQLTQIHFPKNHADSEVCCIVGAGTGLGVGTVIISRDRIIPVASEGGHSGFTAFDRESLDMCIYFLEKTGRYPFLEDFLSGKGLSNIYKYLSPDNKDPEAKDIFRNFSTDKNAEKAVKFFLKIYANTINNIALTVLPMGGIFIAGGIAAKNSGYFKNHEYFVKYLLNNENKKLDKTLKRIPVFLINDYNVSLYGAANAALNLLKEDNGA